MRPASGPGSATPALAGEVASINAVKEEITAGTGDLVDWARARHATFWQADTIDVVSAMTELSAWATDLARQYRQEAIDEFLDSADYKLIAHALATGATLDTREQPAPESKKKFKIPNVCNAFGVDGALLVDLWPELDLPGPVRDAWQPLIDAARDGPTEDPISVFGGHSGGSQVGANRAHRCSASPGGPTPTPGD